MDSYLIHVSPLHTADSLPMEQAHHFDDSPLSPLLSSNAFPMPALSFERSLLDDGNDAILPSQHNAPSIGRLNLPPSSCTDSMWATQSLVLSGSSPQPSPRKLEADEDEYATQWLGRKQPPRRSSLAAAAAHAAGPMRRSPSFAAPSSGALSIPSCPPPPLAMSLGSHSCPSSSATRRMTVPVAPRAVRVAPTVKVARATMAQNGLMVAGQPVLPPFPPSAVPADAQGRRVDALKLAHHVRCAGGPVALNALQWTQLLANLGHASPSSEFVSAVQRFFDEYLSKPLPIASCCSRPSRHPQHARCDVPKPHRPQAVMPGLLPKSRPVPARVAPAGSVIPALVVPGSRASPRAASPRSLLRVRISQPKPLPERESPIRDESAMSASPPASPLPMSPMSSAPSTPLLYPGTPESDVTIGHSYYSPPTSPLVAAYNAAPASHGTKRKAMHDEPAPSAQKRARHHVRSVPDMMQLERDAALPVLDDLLSLGSSSSSLSMDLELDPYFSMLSA